MPGWIQARRHRIAVNVSGRVIRTLLLLLTVAAFAITGLAGKAGPGSVWAYLYFGYAIAMLVNVLVPHVPVSLLVHGYTPGLVTAVLLNLPVLSLLLRETVREGWVHGVRAIQYAFWVPAGLAVMIALCFVIAQRWSS